MHVRDRKSLCGATGQPAHAELRLGHGAAWNGSRHEGSFFVAVRPVRDGHYSDTVLDELIDDARIVVYGNSVDGLYPASEIGADAACELFRLGAEEVASAIEENRSLADAVLPLSVALCGQPAIEQGVDFMSLGRLWALTEYAKGVQPLRDLCPRHVALDAYNDALRVELPTGSAPVAPALRKLAS